MRYYKGLADKWGVDKITRFDSRLVRATWDSILYRYNLEIEDLKSGPLIRDYADVLINATGWLKCFYWPQIRANIVLGSGQTSRAFNLLKVICSIPQIGTTIILVKVSVLQ